MNKNVSHLEDNKKTANVYEKIYGPLYELSPEYIHSAKGFINSALEEMGIRPEYLTNMTVFNIGTGREAYVFNDLGARNVYHADISEKAVSSVEKIIREKGWWGSMHTAICDVCTNPLPWQGIKFDLAYLNGVVHHLHDPVSGILNIANAIDDNGYFHVRLYRSGSFMFFVAYMLRQIIHESEKEYFNNNEVLISQICGIVNDPRSYMDFYDDVFVPYQWLFDPDELIELFNSIGFENKTYYRHIPYCHDAAADSDVEGLYTMSFKKTGKSENPHSKKLSLSSIDQLQGIDYKEEYIRNSVRLFLLLKSDILQMGIEDRAELASSIYRLTHIPAIRLSSQERHAELQKLLKEKVAQKQRK